jgi:hypothetical protein
VPASAAGARLLESGVVAKVVWAPMRAHYRAQKR